MSAGVIIGRSTTEDLMEEAARHIPLPVYKNSAFLASFLTGLVDFATWSVAKFSQAEYLRLVGGSPGKQGSEERKEIFQPYCSSCGSHSMSHFSWPWVSRGTFSQWHFHSRLLKSISQNRKAGDMMQNAMPAGSQLIEPSQWNGNLNQPVPSNTSPFPGDFLSSLRAS